MTLTFGTDGVINSKINTNLRPTTTTNQFIKDAKLGTQLVALENFKYSVLN